jgi:RNA polymerase sigma-70 factor, ECF subfamily
MQDETSWIASAQSGDLDAFERVVEAYQKPVYNLAYRMLGSRAEAEDAAQECFLRAYRALGTYERDRKFGSWLLAIAAHYCVDRLRRRRFVQVPWDGVGELTVGEIVDPEADVIDRERADEISAALQQLPPDYRLVVVLRYWYDMGYEEIAETVGGTVAAVKSRLHRGREALSGHLATSGTIPVRAQARVGTPCVSVGG